MNRRFIAFVVLFLIPTILFAATPLEEASSTYGNGTSSVFEKLRVSLNYGQISTANMKFTSDSIQSDTSFGAFNTLTEVKVFVLDSAYEKGKGFVGKSTADTYLSWQIYSSESLEMRVYIDTPLKAPSVNNTKKNKMNWEVAGPNGKIGTTEKVNFDYSNSSMVVYTHASEQPGLSGSIPLVITTESVKGYPMKKKYSAFIHAEIKTLT